MRVEVPEASPNPPEPPRPVAVDDQMHTRAIVGAGSRPPLDDLGVLERSDELDAEPGVGGGTVRAELGPAAASELPAPGTPSFIGHTTSDQGGHAGAEDGG